MSFIDNNGSQEKPIHDRRATLRVPIRVKVTFACADVRQHGWAANLCEGGLFVNIVTTVPLRTEVTVEALVRDGDRPFTLRAAGWVVRKGKTGTAVQFRDLDGETARVIRSLVQIGADGS